MPEVLKCEDNACVEQVFKVFQAGMVDRLIESRELSSMESLPNGVMFYRESPKGLYLVHYCS